MKSVMFALVMMMGLAAKAGYAEDQMQRFYIAQGTPQEKVNLTRGFFVENSRLRNSFDYYLSFILTTQDNVQHILQVENPSIAQELTPIMESFAAKPWSLQIWCRNGGTEGGTPTKAYRIYSWIGSQRIPVSAPPSGRCIISDVIRKY